MQTWRTLGLATRAWCAIALMEACGDAASQGDAKGHPSGLADASTDTKDDDDAASKGGPSETGDDNAADGRSEVGDGDLADSGTPPACTVDLAAIGCPESYGAALSGAGAECGNLNNPRIGICGGLRVYAFGHDGTTICAYDSSTDALAGGVSNGIPLPSVSNFAPCGLHFAAGQVLPDLCQDPVTSACATDAGTD